MLDGLRAARAGRRALRARERQGGHRREGRVRALGAGALPVRRPGARADPSSVRLAGIRPVGAKRESRGDRGARRTGARRGGQTPRGGGPPNEHTQVAEATTNSRGGVKWEADGAWMAIAGRGEAQVLHYEHWCPGEPNNDFVADEKAAAYGGRGATRSGIFRGDESRRTPAAATWTFRMRRALVRYGTWRPDACWVDVATDGGEKVAAVCRCEGEAYSSSSSHKGDDGGTSPATTAAIVFGRGAGAEGRPAPRRRRDACRRPRRRRDPSPIRPRLQAPVPRPAAARGVRRPSGTRRDETRFD